MLTVDLGKEVGELEVLTRLVLVVHAITVQGVVSAVNFASDSADICWVNLTQSQLNQPLRLHSMQIIT